MQTPWHEQLLVYRLHSERNSEAFAELYDRYAPKVYRYLYFKVATVAEAEDLTAEVFLKTWEYVLRHKDEPRERIISFRAFVYRLAHNLVVDHYRQRREREFLVESAVLGNIPAPEEVSAAATVTRSSDLALVERALRHLKDEYRELVILRYIEGLSTVEISKILEKSRGAVRVTLHRALEALREEVEKLEGM